MAVNESATLQQKSKKKVQVSNATVIKSQYIYETRYFRC